MADGLTILAPRARKSSVVQGPEGKGRLAHLSGEMGIGGTTNYAGQLYTETNPALINEKGYGQPGQRAWGEWERIIRTDCAVETSLGLITAPLRDASIAVKEPKRTHALTDKHVEYVRLNLEEWLEPLWSDCVLQMGRQALGVGFSLHEKVWSIEPSELVPGGQAIRLKKLAQRLANTLEYNAWIEQDGELLEVRQRGIKNGVYVSDLALPAAKLLLLSWNREGNNYAGYSAFRSVWYLCKIREHLLRILGIGHQREALGVPMATMEKDNQLTPGARTKLQRTLENLLYHENAAIVLPPGVKLDWFNSPGANKGNVLETWKALGLAILEVMGSQQVALGTGETGSRSVGEVHNAVRGSLVTGVKGCIEAALNGVGARPYTGLARDIIDANWGPQPSYPKVELVLDMAAVSPTELVAAAVQSINGRLLTPTQEDENHIRAILGLKALTPEIRAKLNGVGGLPAQGPEGFPQAQGADSSPSQTARTGQPPGTVAPTAAGRRVFGRDETGVYVPRRALRPHEEHLDWDGMEDLLTQAKERFEESAKPLLIEELVRVMPDVKSAMADGDPSELSGLRLPFERMSALIEEFLARLRAEGGRHVADERKHPSKAQAKEEARTEGEPALPSKVAAFSRRFTLAKPPRSRRDRAAMVEALMRSQRELLLRRMRARMIDALQKAAIDAVRTGKDPQDIVSDVIADALETKALRQDAASVTTAAFNIGREEVANQLGEVRVVRLSAVMDNVTCEYCERMDGEEFEFGSAEHDAHVPPLIDCEGRHNCRCILVYDFVEPGFRTEETYEEG